MKPLNSHSTYEDNKYIISASILNIPSTSNFHTKSQLIFSLNKLDLNISSLLQSIIDDDIHIISHHPINSIVPWIDENLYIDISLIKFHKFENNSVNL